MSPSLRRTAALTAVVLACILLVAVLGVSVESGDHDPDRIREAVAETNESIEAYEMRIEVAFRIDDETERVVYDLAVDRPGRSNLTVVGPGNVSRQTIVRNRSGTFLYNATENELTMLGETPMNGDLLARLVELMGENRSQYRGEQRIDGSDGVVLEYDAGGENVSLRIGGSAPAQEFLASGSAPSANTTLWIDPEREIPVEVNRSFSAGNVTGWMRYEVVEFDPNATFEDDQFRIDPLPNVTVVDHRNRTEYFDSRAEMTREVDRRVPDPTVPDRFQFRRGTSIRINGSQIVGLSYSAGQASLYVQATYGNVSGGIDRETERVRIANATGQFVNATGYGTVVWECGGVRYSVGGNVDREVVLSVARSIGCPTRSEDGSRP